LAAMVGCLPTNRWRNGPERTSTWQWALATTLAVRGSPVRKPI
jgi:hypothetical protein